MIPWKITWREIRAHRGRAILTAASIVVGVAAVVAVNLSATTVRQSFSAMQGAIAGEADLEIEAAGGELFDQAVLETISDLQEIQEAAPTYERRTVMYVDHERVTVVLLGIDLARNAAVRDYTLAEGKPLSGGDEILLDAAFAEALGLQVSDQVRLLTARGRMTATVVGLLRPQTGAAVSRGGLLFMPLADAQRAFRTRGRINRIQIVLRESADRDRVQAEIARRLPQGMIVRIPAAQAQMGEETMLFFQQALRMASHFILLAALFIVVNAFAMNVTQRRRQLAMMRALGATRRQIRFLILREALFLAVISTTLGVLAGWGGATFLAAALERLFGTDLPPPALTASVAAAAIAFGLGVSLVGAFLPAQKAASITPLEGMHELPPMGRRIVPRRTILAGLIACPAATALLAARLMGWLPGYDAVLGAVLLLVSIVPLFALAFPPCSRLAAGLLRPWARVEPNLARRQLLRRPVRAVLTVGVLFIVSSTGVGLATTMLDNIADIQDWYRRAMTGDFFLRAMTPDLASWELVEMPEDVEPQVRAIPGVGMVYAVRFVRGQAANQSVMIIVRDYPVEDALGVDPDVITPHALRQKLLEGEVTVGSVLAQRANVQPGDTISIETQNGPQAFRIAVLENDYMAGGLTIHLEREVARRRLGIEGADAFILRAQPGRQSEVQAALKQIAEEHGLLMQSYAEITAMIDHMQSGVIAGLWVVMMLGMIVAALGVTNTLSMNVLEQTRELAMLRVVAMTRRQTRRTVLAQASLLGAVGLAPGVLLGVGLAWIINQSLASVVGHPVAFQVRPIVVGAGFLASLILVLAAAWFPARRAARMDPLDALRYE